MKGMNAMNCKELIIDIIREEVPDIAQAREVIKKKAANPSKESRPAFIRWSIVGATVTVIVCFVMLGGYWLINTRDAGNPVVTDGTILHHDINPVTDPVISSSENNNFTLLAFIPYQAETAPSISESLSDTSGEWIELNDKDEFNQLIYGFWTADVKFEYFEYEGTEPPPDFDMHNMDSSMLYNRTLHKSIFLRCEGDNIASVKFSVENNGFFTKANVLTQNNIPVISDDGFTIISQQELGNSFILTNPEEITGDFMLFVGKTFPDDTTSWELNLMINVVATFIDDSTYKIEFLMP